ncbi:MAG: hypothetical protein IPH07_23815 [Deltaproteobacteria bacterium]|nr:hypothetical protein [Deltaproteobacteria bacterium]
MITYRIHCHAEPTPASLSAALDHVERQLGLHQARGQVRRRRCTFRGDALAGEIWTHDSEETTT